MKILAIDTATDMCGVALTEEQRLVAEYRIQQRNVHNEKLVAAIETLLRDVKWQVEDLAGIAVSIGPGSFTGLRIGMSVAKGLAFSAEVPLAAVNTLDAMAHAAYFWRGTVCAVIKARAEEVYFAIYEKDVNRVNRISDYQIADLETLNQSLESGTLVAAFPADLYSAFTQKGLIFPSDDFPVLSAFTIARLGNEKLLQNESVELESIEPFYLKDFQAKRSVSIFS